MPSPARKARQRKPSHFGSYCQSPSGRCSTSLASIGSMSSGTAKAESVLGFIASIGRGTAPRTLFGAAADQISDEHADAESNDQRRGEIVLHHFLGLLHRIVRPSSRVTKSAIGDLAERGSKVAQIVPYGVELVVQILRVELLQKPAGLVLSSTPTHHRHVLLIEAGSAAIRVAKSYDRTARTSASSGNKARAPARKSERSANQLWHCCYFSQASMPCIAFSASSFELYGPPMFFMFPPGMSCIMVHLWLAGSKGHIELRGKSWSAEGDNKR